MATAKLVLNKNGSYKKAKLVKNPVYPLTIAVSHLTKTKYINTGYKLQESDWNSGAAKIKNSFQNSGRANAKVSSMLAIALEIVSLPKTTLHKMTIKELAEVIKNKIDEVLEGKITEVIGVKTDTFTNEGTRFQTYTKTIQERHFNAKRYGYAKTFGKAIKFMDNFLEHSKTPTIDSEILISSITETFLEDLEAYWLGKGNALGGLSIHLKVIRRVFNLAIKDKNTELKKDDYPFGNQGYKIKSGKPSKRAISEDYIVKIRELPYESNTALWHDKNYFLFSFNLRGMNFADLSMLTINNLIKDSSGAFQRLVYRRKKTQRGENVKTFNIKLTEEAKTILSYYVSNKSGDDLIFPILSNVIHCGDDFKIYNTKNEKRSTHNDNLKKIAKDIGLEGSLTTYVARHTFAMAALYKGVPKTEIGGMMGHTTAVTTEAYFDDFDHSFLDAAADTVFN